MQVTPVVRVRRIRPDDGLTLRDLRLRSIADAPDAFGQSLEEALDRPETEWHRSTRQSAQGDDRIWLIAEANGQAVGLVQGRRRRPSTLLLFSMWVDPGFRRLGVGRMLIESLERWSHGWDATQTILWVYSGNADGIRFYRDLGFQAIPDGRDADAGARFSALAMRRDVRLPS